MYQTPVVELQTWSDADGVRFDSRETVWYTNNTGDSVYVDRFQIYLDVTADGTDGEGLVCEGAKAFWDEDEQHEFVYTWNQFSTSFDADDGILLWSFNVPADDHWMSKDPAWGRVDLDQRVADELSYGSGETCGSVANPDPYAYNAWRFEIPGWWVYSIRTTTTWIAENITCDEGVPCRYDQTFYQE